MWLARSSRASPDVNGATLAANYLPRGIRLVVFEYCFEHPRHGQRFLDAYNAAAPVSLFTLWAPLELVQERERGRDGPRRLGDRVEACYRSMHANLDGLGRVLDNLDAPERIAEDTRRALTLRWRPMPGRRNPA